MAILRVLATLPGRSGIPEDLFVNTFHFKVSDQGTTTMQGIADRLSRFYTDPWDGSTLAVGEYLSNFINRLQCEARFYKMDDAKPRVPTVLPITLQNSPAVTDLPEEVALCCSIHSDPPVTARKRGRIYIGPLNVNALIGGEDIAGGYGPSRPNPGFRKAVKDAAQRLMIESNAANTGWVIASQTPTPNYPEVYGGWVDDAWDTQRRRGVDATSRLGFS